jgi:hypothetical protein
VAAAYGWQADLTHEQILGRLFKLDQEPIAARTEPRRACS